MYLLKSNISKYLVIVFAFLLKLSAIVSAQAKFEKRVFNEISGNYITSIMSMETDSMGFVWMILDRKLARFNNGEITYHSKIKGSSDIFDSPTNFYSDPKGILFCQNKKIIVKINPNGELTYERKRDLNNDLKYLIERKSFSNQLGHLTPNYGYFIELRTAYLNKSDITFDKKFFYHLEGNKKKTIGENKDSIIAEVIFKNNHYFFTQNEIINFQKDKKDYTIKAAIPQSDFPISLKKIKKIFYVDNRYFIVSNEGLFSLNQIKGKFYVNKIISSNQLDLKSINSMLTDKNGNWFLFGCENELLQFTKTGMELLGNNSTLFNSANSLLFRGNRIYTNRGGYFTLDGKHYDKERNYLYCYGFNYAKIGNNELLIGGDKFYHHVDSSFNIIHSIPKKVYYSNFIQDEKNRTFLVNKDGIYCWNGTSLKKTNFTIVDPEEFDFLYSCAGNKDTLFIATSTGIVRYKMGNKKPIYPTLLQNYTIRHIQISPDRNSVYAFTEGNGVYVIAGNTIKRINPDINGYLNNAHYFVWDHKSRIWIPTNNGILVTSNLEIAQNLKDSSYQPMYFYFKGPTNYAFVEFNGTSNQAAVTDKATGDWYFSSVKGIVRLNPDSMVTHFPNGNLIIQSTHFNNSDLPGFYFPKSDFQKVSYTLAIPYIGNDQNFLLQYRVLPDFSSWQNVGKLNEITITRGHPGIKKLEVRYRKSFNPNSYYISTWVFEVQPYWYENLLFRIGALLILIVIVYGIIKYKAIIHKRRQAALEREIKSKTEEIFLMVEDLRKSESELKESDLIKEQLIKVLAHDIRSPLISGLFISEHIHQLIIKNPQIENNILPELTSDLKETLQSVYEYVNDFLTWYNHKSGVFTLQLERINLTKLVEEVIQLYHPLVKRKSNQLFFSIEHDLVAIGDYKLLSIVIRNVLDNANKYTSRSYIKLNVSNQPDFINFEIINRADLLSEKEKEIIERGLRDFEKGKLEALSEGLGLKIIGYFASVLSLTITVSFPETDVVQINLHIPKYNINTNK